MLEFSIYGQLANAQSKYPKLNTQVTIYDTHLSWHDHIDYVCDNVSKIINIMTKINSYLGNQCLTSIYYSLDYPYLIYGCLLWGNNYDNPLSQLILLQNKAVRIINDVPLQDHITPHYVYTGRNNVFPYFGNSTETGSFLYPSRFRNKPSTFYFLPCSF